VSAALREAVPVRIGDYQAVVVLRRDGPLTGAGEAPLLAGRDDVRALASAEACAELDLEARRRGVRVVDLLGGARREGVECTALITARTPAEVARTVAERRSAGYTAYKLKSVNGGGPLDAERLGAARYAAGREGRLRIDLNGSLEVAQAVSVLPSLARFDLELVEQPLAASAPAGDWKRVVATGVPVAADESLADPRLAAELAELGVVAAAKLATVGGPRPVLGLAGRITIGSSFETSIGIAAALHVACALEAPPFACGLATRSLREGDLAAGLAPDGPWLRLPSGPGLGVEVDLAALERYRR
jgi:L-alanine-DL-glutamate epimerase-like enolase superfamily enzyme